MPPVVNLLPYIISSIARWGALLRLGYGFVVVLLRHQEFRPNDGDGIDRQNDPADCAQNPRLVEFPADEEAVVVVVEVSLINHVSIIRRQTSTHNLVE